MARKPRVAILYNEPVTTPSSRTYVSETGRLQDVPAAPRPATRGKAPAPVPAPVPAVDLSEVGVMEEMGDIKLALDAAGYKTSIMNVNGDTFRLLDYLRTDRPDVIFNLVECVENEALQEMHVAGVYELLKIPYTGAGPFALGTALNKPRVKEILGFHNILTPRFQVFGLTDKIVPREEMRFPLIVKPSREDASVGISDASVVYSVGDLRKRVRFIHQEFDQPALVEEYIRGRELNVAILGNTRPAVLPISEIDFSGLDEGMEKIVSYAAKWMEGTVAYQGTKGVCPAKLPSAVETRLRETALACYRLIGCRDYARVDFRLAENGDAYVLEVNPNPDISDDAGFARSARAAGFTFNQVVARIVELALERGR
jgi:D-alanine-D-alanine ligase